MLKFLRSQKIAIFILFQSVFFSILNWVGLDSDFQYYSFVAELISQGKQPFIDFFDHKPLVGPITLLPFSWLSTDIRVFLLAHTLLLSVISLLIFRFSSKIFQSNSIGVFVVFAFHAMTCLHQPSNGQLNAYLTNLEILWSLLFLLYANSFVGKKLPGAKGAFYLGILSSLCFQTRFHPILILIIVALPILSYRKKNLQKANLLKSISFYSFSFIGFILTIISIFITFQVDPLAAYNSLIKFNAFYTNATYENLPTYVVLFKTFKIHFFPPLLFVVLPSLLGAFLLDRFNKKTLKFSLQSSSLFSLLLTSLFPICSLLLLQTKHIKSYVLYLFILFFLLILIHFIKNLFNFKYAAILLGLLCWYTAIEQLDQNHYKYELFFKWPEKELLEILDTNNSSDTILLFPASHLLMGARKNPQTHSFYFRTWPIEILLGKEGVSRELKKIKDSNFRFWVAHEKIEIPEEFESIKNCSLVFKKILNYKRHGNTLIYDCKDYH